ncbi:MAG: hypothetical protein WBE27_02525, partial [Microgenomates group bacterium]
YKSRPKESNSLPYQIGKRWIEVEKRKAKTVAHVRNPTAGNLKILEAFLHLELPHHLKIIVHVKVA